MERLSTTPRPGWETTVQNQGLSYYETDGKPYWNESACYVFTRREIDALESATYALNEMCLQAVEHIISRGLWERFAVPRAFQSWVRESWERDERTVYGRFDLAFDGVNVKMLEYNADTPTGLIEAAVIQWFWLQDVRRSTNEDSSERDGWDQFNTLHERLIEAWQALGQESNERLYFASIPAEDSDEDFMTVNYLRDTANQAGWDTEYIELQNVGWNPSLGFVDLTERPIANIFKLYPWEILLTEQFAKYLPVARTRWLEAPWKMLLSNKAILPLLYELFPDSPYILPASLSPLGDIYVKKPLLGREGANTAIVAYGESVLETEGIYTGPSVYQEYVELPDFNGNYPIIGSWMVNGYAAGIGIREADTRITTNKSRFVPHRFT